MPPGRPEQPWTPAPDRSRTARTSPRINPNTSMSAAMSTARRVAPRRTWCRRFSGARRCRWRRTWAGWSRPWCDCPPSAAIRRSRHRRRGVAPDGLANPPRFRLHLQRRAPENLRHHVRRGATRLAVLIAATYGVWIDARAGTPRCGTIRCWGPRLLRASRRHSRAGPSTAGSRGGTAGGMLVTGSYGQATGGAISPVVAACALATALPLWTALFHPAGLPTGAAAIRLHRHAVWLGSWRSG